MTMKLLGAACIALAAGDTLRTLFFQRKREDALLQHMAAALMTMAREIRWKQQPIPAILRVLSEDEIVGKYFEELLELLDSKIPLQSAWKKIFIDFPIEREIILSIDIISDETQLTASLENAAERLEHTLQERRSKRPEQTKLCVAAALSASGGLILLLL